MLNLSKNVDIVLKNNFEDSIEKNENDLMPNEERFKKRQKLKEKVLDWSLRVDINAYNKIFDYKNKCIKIIWALIFIASTLLTIIVCILLLVEYFEYDVITKTNVVYERPSQFPAVTLCDNDQFTTSDAQLFLINISRTYNLSFSNSNDLHSIITLAQMRAANPLAYTNEWRQKLGLRRSQIVCSFFTTDCSKDLEWFYSFEYGNCFRFNSKSNVNYALGEGEKYGVTLSIFPLTNSILTLNTNGMIVYVHNNSLTPTIADSVKIRTGEWSYISVKKTHSRKYPSPYSICRDLSNYESKLYNLILNSNRTYRQHDCFELCIQEKIIAKCGCYYLGFRDYDAIRAQSKPCSNLKDDTCVNIQIQQFNDEECVETSCPLECDVTSYDLTVSSLVNPSIYVYDSLNSEEIKFYVNLINSNTSRSLSYELYKSLFVNVTIYYKSLISTHIIETPKMTVTELLSQIGGSLQLFVSYSIFTFFELIEVFILFGYVYFFKNRNILITNVT